MWFNMVLPNLKYLVLAMRAPLDVSKNVQSDIRAKASVSAGSLHWSMLGFIIWSSHINDEIMILRVTVIPIKMQCQIFITVTV